MKRVEKLADTIKYFEYIAELGNLSKQIEMIKDGIIHTDINLEELTQQLGNKQQEFYSWLEEEV